MGDACGMNGMTGTYEMWLGYSERRIPPGRPKRRWEGNVGNES
jgi:hypothetical protein